MGLESVTNIADLVRTNPTSGDAKSQGDDHIRNLKTALLNDLVGFPGAIMVTGIDGGAVNAYTLTPAFGTCIAYGNRMVAVFSPTVTNTGASTINISALGAKDIKTVAGAVLEAGDLVPGVIYAAFYNGTEFRLLSVTKSYIDNLAFSSALPAQAGNADKFISTNGTIAAWSDLIIATVMKFADGTDRTKRFQLDLSGITTATTRTYIAPNASGTLALTTDIGQRLIAQASISAGANIDFLSTFNATYDDYLIVVDGANHDATGGATQNIRVRFANAGVPDSGSNYFTNTLSSGSTTTSATDAQASSNIINTGRGGNLEIHVRNANAVSPLKSAINFATSQSTATPTLASHSNNISYIGAAISGFRLFWSAGANFAATGTIKVYGIAKS